MTVEMLERYVRSEVENLHLRIDGEIIPRLIKIEERLEGIERRLNLIWLEIDELKVRMTTMQDVLLRAIKGT